MIIFKNKKIQSAIFDMDGTMFDTERLRFHTLKQASQEIFGKPLTEETLIGSLGLSAKKAEELAKLHNGEDFPYAQIRQRADELELEHVRANGVPVKSGLLETLERLKKNGLSLAVATSSRRAIAEEYLINANVMKYFDIVVCGDEVTQGKPHPEIFLKAARALNSPPLRCLMVEDSENGLTSAADAGGLPILIEDIKPPRPEIKARAFQHYLDMQAFLSDLDSCVPNLGVPALTDSFPQSLNEFQVGIHGFGAVGGGYLAQIFSHWDGYTRPREIVAATSNRVLREAIGAFGRFSVGYGALAYDEAIDNVRMIDIDDEQAMIDMYVHSEAIGLCLPETAIRQQAHIVARGLAARFEQRGRELTILVTLNKEQGGRFVRRHVHDALLQLHCANMCDQIMAKTYFAETVVSRIVSKLADKAILRQLRIKSEIFENHLAAASTPPQPTPPSGELDRFVSRFRQLALPAQALNQMHLILFDSETDMPLYAERGSELLERLRQVVTVEDIGEIQTVKNKLWNGPHAIIAWYAALRGHATIGQAMGDRHVSALVHHLLKHEIEPTLLKHLPGARDVTEPFIRTFLERCKASFKDSCSRVGRDPLRKLQRGERVLGTIAMAREHGIQTPALEYGVALAIHYALRSNDDKDKECRIIQEIFATRNSVADVLAYCGRYNGRTYPGLDAERDGALIARIADHFTKLSNPESAHWEWPSRIGQSAVIADVQRTIADAQTA